MLYFALINQRKSLIKIKKKSILRKSKTKKTLLWPQKTMLLKIRKNRIIKTTKSAIIVKKRAILLETILKFQKTSIDFSNLCDDD